MIPASEAESLNSDFDASFNDFDSDVDNDINSAFSTFDPDVSDFDDFADPLDLDSADSAMLDTESNWAQNMITSLDAEAQADLMSASTLMF